MILRDVFSAKMMNADLSSEEKDEVLEELVELFVAEHPAVDRAQVLATVVEREEKMSTGIMRNIAVPHGRTAAVTGVHGVIGVSRRGIDFESLDGEPVYLFVLLVSSLEENEHHLRILKRVSQLLQNPSFYSDISAQETATGMYEVLCRYEDALLSL